LVDTVRITDERHESNDDLHRKGYLIHARKWRSLIQ